MKTSKYLFPLLILIFAQNLFAQNYNATTEKIAAFYKKNKVKTIKVYRKKKEGKDTLFRTTELNKEGQEVKMESIYDDGPDISLCEYNSKGLLKKHTLIDAEDNVIHMQCFNYKKGKLNSKTLNDGDYKWITRYYYKNGKLNYISKKSGTEVREEMTYDSKGNLIKKRSIRNMNLKKKSFDWAPISTCTYMYDMNNNILEERDCKFRMLCSIYKYEYNKMQFLVKMSQSSKLK